MIRYRVVFSRHAVRDAVKVKQTGLKENVEKLLGILEENPYKNPPPCEKLVGDLAGCYSRRINLQHRLVYAVYEEERVVKVLRMWTHYE